MLTQKMPIVPTYIGMLAKYSFSKLILYAAMYPIAYTIRANRAAAGIVEKPDRSQKMSSHVR